ncbi:MAG: DUF819 family protein [Desulfobacterales bacterium]|nr:DUF819 family protein [Desulfobacterales bacterium]
MTVSAIILFYVLFPVLVIYLCQRYPAADKIGAVIICYGVGILLGNCGVLPPVAGKALDGITTVTIPLALPLLLFSLDVRNWLRMAGKTMISLLLILVSVTVMAMICHLVFGPRIEEGWKVAGLMIGVYTGGTPNLAAIKTALDVTPSTYLAVHTADTVVCAVYILFSITVAQRLFGRFLPAFTFAGTDSGNVPPDDVNDYTGIFCPAIVSGLLKALGLSMLIFAVGGGLSVVVPQNVSMTTAILAITTLGIGASLVERIRRIPMTFQLGQYLILIFCLAVASMADLTRLVHTAPILLLYVTVMVFGTLCLHLILAAFFRIDTDTVIITSMAAICSPPFVPMVAGALKNREIIVSGLTTGIIGYAIGNYLGVLCAYLFKGIL